MSSIFAKRQREDDVFGFGDYGHKVLFLQSIFVV